MRKWLIELRKTVYLYDCQFTTKTISKGANEQPEEEAVPGLGMGMWQGVSRHEKLPAASHVHQPGNSQNSGLLGFYGGFMK